MTHVSFKIHAYYVHCGKLLASQYRINIIWIPVSLGCQCDCSMSVKYLRLNVQHCAHDALIQGSMTTEKLHESSADRCAHH